MFAIDPASPSGPTEQTMRVLRTIYAMLLAVPLGVAFGWILCSVINPRAFGWTVQLHLGADAVLTPVFWGLVAAACAGLINVGRQETGTGKADAGAAA